MKHEMIIEVMKFTENGKVKIQECLNPAQEKPDYVLKRFRLKFEIPDVEIGIDGDIITTDIEAITNETN